MLAAAPGQTVADLAVALERSPAFRRPDGKRLSISSRWRAIRRELRKPALAALVRVETEVEKHGWTRQRIGLNRGLSTGTKPCRSTGDLHWDTGTLSPDEGSACAAAGSTGTPKVSLDNTYLAGDNTRGEAARGPATGMHPSHAPNHPLNAEPDAWPRRKQGYVRGM